jgi:predicted dehydrogenase
MIEVGLIGTGYWGPNIANSFLATGRARLRWICDLNAERVEAFAKRYPGSRVSADAAELLADPGLDAVAIATPTRTHFALAKAALEAGKHVLVEKPLATSVEEGSALARLAEKHGRVLMVGHVFQYNSTIQALKRMIDGGELGAIHYMSFTRTNLGPVRTDVNALWDLATHDISIMIYLMGASPVSVTATGNAYLNRDIEDVAFAVFSFASGSVAQVHASWLNPRKVRTLTVVGDKKMAVWDDLELKEPIRLYDKRVDVPPPQALEGSYMEHKTMVVDGGSTVPEVTVNRPLQAECEHFVDCVERGAKPDSDGWNGVAVVKALEAATTSMRRGATAVPIA